MGNFYFINNKNKKCTKHIKELIKHFKNKVILSVLTFGLLNQKSLHLLDNLHHQKEIRILV